MTKFNAKFRVKSRNIVGERLAGDVPKSLYGNPVFFNRGGARNAGAESESFGLGWRGENGQMVRSRARMGVLRFGWEGVVRRWIRVAETGRSKLSGRSGQVARRGFGSVWFEFGFG